MQFSCLDMLITDFVSVNMSVNLLSPECKHNNTRDVFYILHFMVGEMTQLLKVLAAKSDLLSSIPRGRGESTLLTSKAFMVYTQTYTHTNK